MWTKGQKTQSFQKYLRHVLVDRALTADKNVSVMTSSTLLTPKSQDAKVNLHADILGSHSDSLL